MANFEDKRESETLCTQKQIRFAVTGIYNFSYRRRVSDKSLSLQRAWTSKVWAWVDCVTGLKYSRLLFLVCLGVGAKSSVYCLTIIAPW